MLARPRPGRTRRYAATPAAVEGACKKLAAAARTQRGRWPSFDAVLGFDVEWKVTYEAGQTPRPVATVQLAAHDYACVFHVSRLGGAPPPLRAILADARVVKVGVGAHNDARKLSRDYQGCDVAPVVDCRDLADAANVAGPRGLADLVQSALGCALPKPAKTRTGDWEAFPLSRAQRDYAALDA